MTNYYDTSRKEWFSRPQIVAGVMTGTSLDGIDIAVAEFEQQDKRHVFRLLGTYFTPYSTYLHDKILNVTEKKRPVSDIAELQVELAEVYAAAIHSACNITDNPISSIKSIGIHGQTVWHNPPGSKKKTAATLQLANGSTLAQILQIPVVSDFRSADIAAGGQGAPLVPVFDAAFLRHDDYGVCTLNIGGIANITLLPARSSSAPVSAFDTGPGNMLIDTASILFFGKNFDDAGKFAQAGICIPGLLKICLEHDFLRKAPPKSTGREMFGRHFLDKLLSSIRLPATPGEDVIRTVTEFTAESIAINIRLFGNDIRQVIASGGGIHNPTLMNCLMQRLGDIELLTSDDFGIPADFKEAMCFAYLAYLTLGGQPGNIPSVTGAKQQCVLGSISIP